ncbi:MAG: hypothetical protein ACRDN6_14900 [Gaiellaceae bacterium]
MTDVAHMPLAETAERVEDRVAPSFPELVWAHFKWERALHSDGPVHPEVEARYRRTLAEFERKHGELQEAYWSTTNASAVGVTVKQAPRLLRYLGKDPTLRFHSATDWVTKEAPAIAGVMQRCETLAIRSSEVLRGTGEHISMQWIHTVASHLLGFIDRNGGEPKEGQARAFADEQLRELAKVEHYYDRAGNKAARLVYFWGMMIGVLVLAAIAATVAGALWAIDIQTSYTIDIQTFFACYVAGALGALVSVMSRMNTGKFALDYEVGRPSLRRLGSFRPVLGAVFGVALYFVLASGILMTEVPDDEQRFFYYGTLAFVAGFSERWTKVILGGAERTILPPGSEPQEPEERDRYTTMA